MDKSRMPQHIAIIMDGNGRWAKKRLLPRALGHKQGVVALENLRKDAEKLGVKHLTVYAFSTENWKRSGDEIEAIMNLLSDNLEKYIDDNDKNTLSIDFVGDLSAISPQLQEKARKLTTISKGKPGIQMHVALNYGGRDEITRAVKAMIEKANNGEIKPEDITEDYISSCLDTRDIPDPELVIRTSGEMRTSNFLPWQSVYSEYYITDKLWPDFTIEDLIEAIEFYQSRDRRFGGRNEGK